MVRDPSIVSPTLTGVFIGGGHNKHGDLKSDKCAPQANEEKFELGLPFTLVSGLFSGPRLCAVARRGFLDFCGNRLVGFLNATFS